MPDAPWVPSSTATRMLVNGKLFPYLDVEPRRYRFRVLNASNARFYDLSLRPRGRSLLTRSAPIRASLPAPVALDQRDPGARRAGRPVVDFAAAAGQKVLLKSQAFELMQFRVGAGPRRAARGAAARGAAPDGARSRPPRR